MVDYRKLLWKYINHVGHEEGTTFLSWLSHGDDTFDDDEIDALKVLDANPKEYPEEV